VVVYVLDKIVWMLLITAVTTQALQIAGVVDTPKGLGDISYKQVLLTKLVKHIAIIIKNQQDVFFLFRVQARIQFYLIETRNCYYDCERYINVLLEAVGNILLL
jgi:hypothetical protein